MMEQLEGTSIDLIHRRRVRSSLPAYGIILMAAAMVVALPLVKVDMVSSSPGMIRPMNEPVAICSPMTGIVDSAVIRDHLKVYPGDTLVWLNRDIPETRIREYGALILGLRDPIRDIRAILRGEAPTATTRYIQSYRNHLAAGHHLELRRDFLEKEFLLSEKLYLQDVIPESEFEQIKSRYLVSCAMLEDHREGYLSTLENELYRLEEENRSYTAEIRKIRATFRHYCMIAPAAGILRQCAGITKGSAVQQGERLGTIAPSGRVVAECYASTRDIGSIEKGIPVRLRFDTQYHRAGSMLETEVAQIDPDVVVLNGRSVYRIRCLVENPYLDTGKGDSVPLISGMTFMASMILDRRSLGSIALEKLNRWGNPRFTDHHSHQGNENEE